MDNNNEEMTMETRVETLQTNLETLQTNLETLQTRTESIQVEMRSGFDTLKAMMGNLIERIVVSDSEIDALKQSKVDIKYLEAKSTKEVVSTAPLSPKPTLVQTNDSDSPTAASIITAEASIELSPVKYQIAAIDAKIKQKQEALSPVATKSIEIIPDQATLNSDIVEECDIDTAEEYLIVTSDNNNVADDHKDNDSDESFDVNLFSNFQLAKKVIETINALTMRHIMAMIVSKQMLGSLLL